MAKVELKNLTKKYGEVVAVQNMNLTIPHNEFLVLVGPSGWEVYYVKNDCWIRITNFRKNSFR